MSPRYLQFVGVLFLLTAAVCVIRSARGEDDAQPDTKSQAPFFPTPKPVEPVRAGDLDGAILRGLDFLVKDQNKDGSWGTAERTKGLDIYAPVPGAHHAFRAAVTSLCISAFIETGVDTPEARSALNHGENWLVENLGHLRRATPDALYNVWGHAYAIQALVRMHKRHAGDEQRLQQIDDLIRSQIEFLDRYESVDGGWAYYDFRAGAEKPATIPTSFTTATVLIAFDDARQIGILAPEKLVRRGVAALKRQWKPDFTYLYDEEFKYMPMHPINQPGGSLGRTQSCNLALRKSGDERISDEVLEGCLDRLFSRDAWLDVGRKRPIPHESYFFVAGYFYYYGHYYAALCIEQLPQEKRARHQDQLAHKLLPLQEKDGSWWDYPLYNYHQQYGTAFALMSLVRCKSAGTESEQRN